MFRNTRVGSYVRRRRLARSYWVISAVTGMRFSWVYGASSPVSYALGLVARRTRSTRAVARDAATESSPGGGAKSARAAGVRRCAQVACRVLGIINPDLASAARLRRSQLAVWGMRAGRTLARWVLGQVANLPRAPPHVGGAGARVRPRPCVVAGRCRRVSLLIQNVRPGPEGVGRPRAFTRAGLVCQFGGDR